MVVGESEKMPAAIIQPNFDFIVEWAQKKQLNINLEPNEIVKSKIVIERIQKDIDFHNKKFGKWEQIKKFELTPDVWTPESGQLTPTMKMKRNIIKSMYRDLYDNIYLK